MKKIQLILLSAIFALCACSKEEKGDIYVNPNAFEDPNFTAVLNVDYGVPLDPATGRIDLYNADTRAKLRAITRVVADNQNISSLEGVEYLPNLIYLSCSDNNLTSLDLTGNKVLQYLNCQDNELTDLNVSGLSNLASLYVNQNKLTSLNLSGLTNLKALHCYDNELTSLDPSKSRTLQYLYCQDNELTSLDLRNNTALNQLTCEDNHLTSLYVTRLASLTSISCNSNKLTSLDLTGLSGLRTLYCYDNHMLSLDVSGSPLTTLYCGAQTNISDVETTLTLELLQSQLSMWNANKDRAENVRVVLSYI